MTVRASSGVLVDGRFVVERLAGSGGMGAVYRAFDRKIGAPIALKVLHGRGVQDAPRFVREAELLAALRHPGIVRYIAHGTTEGGELWLALEWLDGESLADRLARGGLTAAETVDLGARVAEALGVAHEAGIVH
ncbi:MAG TPA: protein kinase, partial [Byssovorax sp.]